jgi:hypothetical protein
VTKPARFSHYSREPMSAVHSVAQVVQADFKPQGFWLSVDGPDDWNCWTKENNYGRDGFTYRYRVRLDLSRVLWLSRAEQLAAFTDEFQIPMSTVCGLPLVEDRPFLRQSMFIAWPRVAERYAGIIIAPYQWSCRLAVVWYYAWDCASGCVWDASAVTGLRLLRAKRARKERAR